MKKLVHVFDIRLLGDGQIVHRLNPEISLAVDIMKQLSIK
jgi:hypothetical protein